VALEEVATVGGEGGGARTGGLGRRGREGRDRRDYGARLLRMGIGVRDY
jgi:hypothetical protein